MTKKAIRKTYSRTDGATKLEVVERILTEGISVRTASEDLGVSYTSMLLWIKQYKENGPTFFSDNKKGTVGIWIDEKEHAELIQAQKELKDAQLEVEILKKFHTFLKTK